MNKRLIIKSVVFSLLILSLNACTDNKINYTLNRTEKKYVDSLFRSKIKALQLKADSLCTIERDTHYQQFKDSLIEIRLSEIENILPQ